MSASAYLALYLALFALRLLWESTLILLNISHVQRASRFPPQLVGRIMDRATYERSAAYTLARCRFALASGLFSSAVVLAVVASGALGALDRIVRSWGLPGYLPGIVYFFLVSAFFTLVSLPASLYRQFAIEERFGFNRMSVGLFFADLAKNVLLAAGLSAPLLLALFWFVERAGRWWWILGFLAASAFQLSLSVIYPTLIAPLFNKFTPLEHGGLRERIEAFAEKLGFAARGIYVMDGSKRTGHANAFFTGFGRTRRVVLFDTLLATLSHDGVLAVLAHEIGHAKRHHVAERLALSTAMLLLGFWLLGLLLPQEPFYQAFGFDSASPYALLVIVSFFSAPFTFFLSPLLAARSRAHEHEADRYAAQAMGGPSALVEALIAIGRNSLVNLTPHPLYSLVYNSHPTLAERIRALETTES